MITVLIDGIDRTDLIEWSTFRKTEILTKEPDILEFQLKNYPSKTFQPEVKSEVIVTLDATRIFGGVIVESEEVIDGQLKFYRVSCKDFTHLLDRTLVVRRYESLSANDIIDNIVADFVTEPGFTTTNVVAPNIIADVNFNYFFVSDALQKLANILDFDWYVDYFKDIHFFSEEQTIAPFELDETSGNFNWNSLQIASNIHQLRNSIIVRGGVFTGELVPDSFVGDGSQTKWQIGSKRITITVKLNNVTQTLGREGFDEDDVTIAVLYNKNSGHIIFKTTPSGGDDIDVTSQEQLPVIAQKDDLTSITQFGVFQFVVVDKNILSKEAARLRADIELQKWADTVNNVNFITYKDGLRVGERMTVNIPSRNINKNFQITRITVTARDGIGSMQYNVQLLASEEVTMVDVLSDLLINRPLSEIFIEEDEILDLLRSFFETITLTEDFTATVFPTATPVFEENVDFPDGELVTTVRVDPFGVGVSPEWVAAPHFPDDSLDDNRAPFCDTDAFAQTP